MVKVTITIFPHSVVWGTNELKLLTWSSVSAWFLYKWWVLLGRYPHSLQFQSYRTQYDGTLRPKFTNFYPKCTHFISLILWKYYLHNECRKTSQINTPVFYWFICLLHSLPDKSITIYFNVNVKNKILKLYEATDMVCYLCNYWSRLVVLHLPLWG